MPNSHKNAATKSLSESLTRRLNSYTLIAGAAGVAMLAASIPADAKVINEQINFALSGDQIYDFNPAHQTTPPFLFMGSFINRSNTWWNRAWFQPNSAGASAIVDTHGLPAELASGSVIGSSRNWGKGASSGLLFTYGPYGRGTREHHKGNFGNPGFLGFRITISGKQYYGWVRLKFSGQHLGNTKEIVVTTEIVNCAFETTPGKSIRAGQTKETDDATSNATLGSSPEASPASLGMLALGAQGINQWRH